MKFAPIKDFLSLNLIQKLVVLLGLMALVLLTWLIFSRINQMRFINSDILYLEALWQDLFVDRISIQDWQVLRAPAFLPDWPLYFLIRSLTFDFKSTHQFFMMTIWFVDMLLFYQLVSLPEAGKFCAFQKYLATLSFGLVLSLPLAHWSSKGSYGDLPLFDPAIHTLTIFWGLPLLVLWLRDFYHENQGRPSYVCT